MGDAFLIQNIKKGKEITYIKEGLTLYLDAADSQSYSGTGNTWFDLSGNNRNATRINNVPFNSTEKYFDFNGSSHYFTLNTSSVQASSQITMEFWNFGILAQSSYLIWGTVSTAQDITIHLPWSDSVIYFDAGNPFNRINRSVTAAEYQGWQHWTFTKANGTMSIYRNGVLWHSGAGTSNIPTLNNLLLGRNNAGTSHRGYVSLVRIYNRALSLQEIQQNYNLGRL
jgi:hypothetical protein